MEKKQNKKYDKLCVSFIDSAYMHGGRFVFLSSFI